VLVMVILGGLGHLRGALIGAFAFALLQEFFQSEAIFGAFARHWHLGLGLDGHRLCRLACRTAWCRCPGNCASACSGGHSAAQRKCGMKPL